MKNGLSVMFLLVLLLTQGCSQYSSKTTLYKIEENGKIGYIDSLGRVIISPQYTFAGNFSEGLAVVADTIIKHYVIDTVLFDILPIHREGDSLYITYGYINWKNSFVIKPNLIFALDLKELGNNNLSSLLEERLSFSKDNLAVFRDASGRYGYINKKGVVTIEPQFSDAKMFTEGKAPVKYLLKPIDSNQQLSTETMQSNLDNNNKWGCIDTKGNLLFDYQYTELDNYHQGRTFGIIHLSVEMDTDIDGTLLKDENNNIVVDKSSAVKGSAPRNTITWNLLLLDEKGNAVGAPINQIHAFHPFSENGIACGYPNQVAKWLGIGVFFIDKEGNYINPGNNLSDIEIKRKLSFPNKIEPFPEDVEILDCTDFHEGFASVKFDEDKWVYIDTDMIACGKSPETFIYEDAGPFSGGLAAVKINGEYGYINTNFDIVIPCIYSSAEAFNGELAKVSINRNGLTLISYINRKGEIVWQKKEYQRF